jgi:hypothetical protein
MHGFYAELFDTARPRHADLLPTPSAERTRRWTPVEKSKQRKQ